MQITQSRRQFLATLSSAGAARLFGMPPARAADRPLETTTVRFAKIPGICNAPQYIAEELLRAEGFTEPSLAAQRMVDRGLTPRYDYALQALSEIPYPKWREYDAEDTLRFYALRLREAGMIKSTPQKIIADGTDWRFLNELKRELKA